MIDLGGGSCELTISNKGHIRETVSLPLGAVRLTNEFLRHDPPRKSELKRLRGFITREVGRVVDRIVAARAKAVIATSGTAAALAAVASHLQKGPKKRQPANVSRALMDRIAKLICRLPIEDRRKLQGIGPRRAEIIAAGALVYDELRRLAARKMAQEAPGHTLQATALVHEAYLRLKDGDKAPHWDSRAHFFGAAAEAMRRILIDHARRKQADKRGGQSRRVPLEAAVGFTSSAEELLDIDEALTRLAALSLRQSQVVELRYFAGLSEIEIADLLRVSERTVRHDWSLARAWLYRTLSAADVH